MALVAINQPRGQPQKESTLDKILKGVNIAESVMGTAIAIPKFIQDRKIANQQADIAKKQIGLREQELAQEKELFPIKKQTAESQAAAARAGAFSDIAKGYTPAQEGQKGVFEFEGTQWVPKQDEANIFGNEANKMKFAQALKDYDQAMSGEKGAQEWTFGNAKVWLKPKAEDPLKRYEGVDGLRNEFIKQPVVKTFAEQDLQFNKLLEAAKQKTGAGDLALIFSYMKMLDPGSTVREGEYITAQNAGSIPQNVYNMYNRILSGEKVSVNRDQFVNAAKAFHEKAKSQYDGVRKYYKDLATKRGWDDDDVIVPVQVVRAVNTGPTDEDAKNF